MCFCEDTRDTREDIRFQGNAEYRCTWFILKPKTCCMVSVLHQIIVKQFEELFE